MGSNGIKMDWLENVLKRAHEGKELHMQYQKVHLKEQVGGRATVTKDRGVVKAGEREVCKIEEGEGHEKHEREIEGPLNSCFSPQAMIFWCFAIYFIFLIFLR